MEYQLTQAGEFSDSKLRRARKPNECLRCRAPIVPGDRYYEYRGETPAYQTGQAYCLACAIEAGAVEIVQVQP